MALDFPLSSSRAELLKGSDALNQRFSCQPAETLARHERAQMLWTAAKIATLTIFLAGSIAGAIALSMINPSALIIFALGFATGMQVVSELTSWFDRKIAYHGEQKDQYKRITEIYQELADKTEWDLERSLSREGVSTWEIQDFDRIEGGLKTIAIALAHLIYRNETTETLRNAAQEAQEKLDREKEPQFKRIFAREAFLYTQAAAISRLHAAYDLHVLLNPFCQKKLSDFGALADRRIEDVLLDRAYAKEDQMFFFPDPSKTPLTFDELNDSSLYSIQQHFS